MSDTVRFIEVMRDTHILLAVDKILFVNPTVDGNGCAIDMVGGAEVYCDESYEQVRHALNASWYETVRNVAAMWAAKLEQESEREVERARIASMSNLDQI